jgi:glycosyltransferase involved in cell wall biosynthesis
VTGATRDAGRHPSAARGGSPRSMLWVDDRWQGEHGIGRYAREVLTRLPPPWRSAGVSVPTGSWRSALTAPVPGARGRHRVLYSPGYNALRTRARQILTLHDLIHLEGTGWSAALHRAYYGTVIRRAVLDAGLVLTVSAASRRAISAWLDDPVVRVVDCGNGVSPVFRPVDVRGTESASYFLFVGNSRPHKNVGVVLEALALLSSSTLVAVVPDGDELGALARKAGVEDRVRILHAVPDEELARLYSGARAVLQPSLVEGFGLPAAEGIACGVPVVYWSGCESVREIARFGGLPVDDPSSAEAWAAVMAGAGGRRHRVDDAGVRRAYAWPRVAAAVAATLEGERP